MNSKTIKELRGQIDMLDDQIADLVRKRIEVSNSIMSAKPAGQVIDAQREEDIYLRYSGRLVDASTPDKVKRLVRAVLAAAELYPEKT